MSGFQEVKDLRELSGQTATCGYEEELHRQTQELDVSLTPEIKQHRADVQQLSVGEEDPHEQQEGSSSLDQEDSETVHIKEEQEELWSSQEGLDEADIKFPFTPVSVKSEDDEEKPQSSQLHHRHTEEMETGADGEDCGGAEPERDSDPERGFYPETYRKKGGSRTETKDPRGRQSGFKSVRRKKQKGLKADKKSKSCSQGRKTFQTEAHLTKHMDVLKGGGVLTCSECGIRFSHKSSLARHMIIHSGEKRFSCFQCGKRFTLAGYLTKHMRIHAGERPFSCSECGKGFNDKTNMIRHLRIHTGEKPFSCSLCEQRFSWCCQLQRHTRVGCPASETHENQTELNREAETGADGEDCGGPEQVRNSDPERHVHPEVEVQIEESSETDDSDDWKESREHESFFLSVENIKDKRMKSKKKSHKCLRCGNIFKNIRNLNQHMRIHTGEKPFSCSECGKRFNNKANLSRHMRLHTGEKPFSCSECDKSFQQKSHLTLHMAHHREEKPFSCTVCDKRFIWPFQMKKHKCAGGQC
ncbi:zinc finger protein OZF-like [Labrus mixtus]|uniref:zinc finger protein OZF-like n=1 Tax=Labrus mixtus TaxID=508554 RepID=UPI0029C0114C|nr:zinc finger protein OZF-like [Labrus mixtus]